MLLEGKEIAPIVRRQRLFRLYGILFLCALAAILFLTRGFFIFASARLLSRAGTAIYRTVIRQEETNGTLLQEEGDIQKQMLLEENEQLRTLLRVSSGELQTVSARVMARSASLDRAELLLDKGTSADIIVGSAVVVADRTLIGTVVSVTEDTARVRLLTDYRSRIPARLKNTKTIGVVEGAGGALLAVSFIPQTVPIKLEDLIFTSGLGPPVIEGLLIGTVRSVEHEETEAFQTARVEPTVDARFFDIVSVVISPML